MRCCKNMSFLWPKSCAFSGPILLCNMLGPDIDVTLDQILTQFFWLFWVILFYFLLKPLFYSVCNRIAFLRPTPPSHILAIWEDNEVQCLFFDNQETKAMSHVCWPKLPLEYFMVRATKVATSELTWWPHHMAQNDSQVWPPHGFHCDH